MGGCGCGRNKANIEKRRAELKKTLDARARKRIKKKPPGKPRRR